MRIAINTGGGDAPGLNAVIRSATLAALSRGWEIFGIRDGYDGLLFPERFADGGVFALGRDTVHGITSQGGTILGTTNRGNPFQLAPPDRASSSAPSNHGPMVVEALERLNIDVLVAAGGDGSLAIAAQLAELGVDVIGVPKTIDNDLCSTAVTFGFDSAVSFATECIDRLFSTAEAHRRVMVVEVMGRTAGWIALHSGVASSVHAILIPEIPYRLGKVAAMIEERYARGSDYAMVVVAEGARPIGGHTTTVDGSRFGGIGEVVADQLGELTGIETRSLSLGHLVRGGSPSARDRILGHRCGAAAIRLIEEGHRNVMVAIGDEGLGMVPLAEIAGKVRQITPDEDVLRSARDVGICFGD